MTLGREVMSRGEERLRQGDISAVLGGADEMLGNSDGGDKTA